MSNTLKNILVAVIFFALLFAGYFAYQQRDAAELNFTEDETVRSNALANAQVFIQRRALLDSIEFDTSLFEDPRFRSFESFTNPLPEQPVGRENPFAPAAAGAGQGSAP